jgi:HPt (histidine-containing phosphotransfer) domain-containing protein
VLLQYPVDGVDTRQGLRRFEGDSALYLDVLRSYAQNTPPLLDTMQKPTQETLAAYSIAAHGIKGSSRGIGAEDIGLFAEELEVAAKSGDFVFVQDHNQDFLAQTRQLIAALWVLLDAAQAALPKIAQAKPDHQTLVKLCKACENYCMDGIDEALEQLEQYSYASDGSLVVWLREKATGMEFEAMHEQLKLYLEQNRGHYHEQRKAS